MSVRRSSKLREMLPEKALCFCSARNCKRFCIGTHFSDLLILKVVLGAQMQQTDVVYAHVFVK